MSAEPDARTRIDMNGPLTDDEYRRRLRELPPSAKLVARVLDDEAPLTHAELVEESLLPDRTVRYALERLEGAALVESRLSFQDARKRLYVPSR